MDFVRVTQTTIIDNDSIYFLWDYHPKNRGIQDRISEQILTLKDLHKKVPFSEDIINMVDLFAGTFSKYFIKKLEFPTSDYIFCLVPSHLSGTDNKNGIYMFSRWCKTIRDYFDKDIIIRYRDIDSLHGGGDRSIEVHLNSLKINKYVKRKKVIVIDDVTTTGNSLLACKKLLEQSGANEVILFSFAKTIFY